MRVDPNCKYGRVYHADSGTRMVEVENGDGSIQTEYADKDGRPVNKDGWPKECINGEWRDVDPCS